MTCVLQLLQLPSALLISAPGNKFPEELSLYGLTEELLASTFSQVLNNEKSLSWKLSSTPTVGFYHALHRYLKRWPTTSRTTKIAIGKFYIAIDPNLKAKGGRPDNIYRFIEKVSQSETDQLVNYGNMQKCILRQEMKAMQLEVQNCNQMVEQMSTDYERLKEEFKSSKCKLENAEQALRDITNENVVLKKSQDTTVKKFSKFEKLKTKCALLEEECAKLQVDNIDLSMEVSELESEVACNEASDRADHSDFTVLSACSKTNGKFPPAIRKLYYSMLADQIPPSKIAETIKIVLKTFHPSLDVDKLQLPKRSCASYMRREELKTISNAHKSTVLSEQAAQGGGFHLNTDGTTKAQKKIGGVVINDTVVSVNELPDGTAMSAINDISRELEKLRKTAHDLGLPNPNSINWTLLLSSTSDSASTQKRINKLIEECRKADEERFGPATQETLDLVRNFCSMHLGVNLRKAFLSGIDEGDYGNDDDSSTRKYHPVDTLVHEFCKLLGKHGVPEYTCGAQSFPDFLELMCTTDNEKHLYYKTCAKVTLDRQVGSRYFVSAANASKIVFLKVAGIEYLKFTGKCTGNKLERAVYVKLNDPAQMTLLRADALMYYHVYADLVMLSKSIHLEKSTMDMNVHYLELKMFLQEVRSHPEIVLDKNARVFTSEGRLYGNEKIVNHRLGPNSHAVYEKLFTKGASDPTTLYPVLVSGSAAMEEKLCSYASSQLPGGKYWDPEPAMKDILSQLKPTNDVCESVLGLNDYLTTAIPNLHPMTRANLVQVKKNKTLKWLSSLPETHQVSVINHAIKQRHSVLKEYKEEEHQRATQRRENMLQAKIQRETLKRKMQEEKEQLSQQHLITSSTELYEAISAIDNESNSVSNKKSKKVSLLKTQILIRKKVLKQKVNIVFSRSKKQRPLSDVIKELDDFICANSPFADALKEPESLVGKRITHKFEVDSDTGETMWFTGSIVQYDASTNTHEIVYDGEDKHCYFDIAIDLVNGDLKVLS